MDAVRKVAPKTELIGVVTKVDKVGKDKVGEQLLAMHDLLEGAEVIPVSATEKIQLDVLADVIADHLPEAEVLS